MLMYAAKATDEAPQQMRSVSNGSMPKLLSDGSIPKLQVLQYFSTTNLRFLQYFSTTNLFAGRSCRGGGHRMAERGRWGICRGRCAQFTCFSGTKVQKLTRQCKAALQQQLQQQQHGIAARTKRFAARTERKMVSYDVCRTYADIW